MGCRPWGCRVGLGGVTDTREAAQAEFSQAGPLEGGGGFFFPG